MRFRCPNCSHAIELIADQMFEDVSCPSCGSSFNLSGSDEDTVTVIAASKIPALQHFQLLETIGMGQFGRVWKARDPDLERMVAVKIPHNRNLTPEEAAFFYREARSAAQLKHPNIVTVYEVGSENDTVYIVSEFVDGVPLSDWAKQYKPHATQAARLCVQIARALQHAHEQGVIHRDLKPANIVIDGQGNPHITDFGLAKREGADVTIAVTGQILGTPAYVAPEQVLSGHSADKRSDLYSLGVVLYELLTGQRPFVGSKRLLLHQVLYDDPRPLRSLDKDVPKDLETICLKALAKRPEERYATADEMADDLERYLREEPILARRTAAPVRVARWARRRPALVTCIVLAVVVVLLSSMALFSGRSATARPIALDTEPTGAKIVLVPLDDRSGRLQYARAIDAGESPIQVSCEPGDYLVVAYMNEELFHEVYRHVPAEHEELPGTFSHNFWQTKGDVIHLPRVTLFDTAIVGDDMALVTGGKFTMDSDDGATIVKVGVPDYYVDVTETTIDRITAARMNLPANMRRSSPPEDYPLYDVSWDEAAVYAEQMGKRLLHEIEFQYLVTMGGSISDATGWEKARVEAPGPVRANTFDRLDWKRCTRTLVGMRSNVLEWTANWWAGRGTGFDRRVVRGGYYLAEPGPDQKIDYEAPPPRIIFYRPVSHARLGFRCARSVRPAITAKDSVQLNVDSE